MATREHPARNSPPENSRTTPKPNLDKTDLHPPPPPNTVHRIPEDKPMVWGPNKVSWLFALFYTIFRWVESNLPLWDSWSCPYILLLHSPLETKKQSTENIKENAGRHFSVYIWAFRCATMVNYGWETLMHKRAHSHTNECRWPRWELKAGFIVEMFVFIEWRMLLGGAILELGLGWGIQSWIRRRMFVRGPRMKSHAFED